MKTEANWVEINQKQVEITQGITLNQLLLQLEDIPDDPDNPIAMASINGRRTSLSEPLNSEDRIRLILLHDEEAQPTIQRTVLFMLAVAAEQLFPDHFLWVNFSYGGGMYCQLKRDEPLTEKEIRALEKRMFELAEKNLPITPQIFGLRALLKMYQRNGDTINYTATKYIRRDHLTLYRMEGNKHLYYGRQLPSTGMVNPFKLVAESPGFVLLSQNKKNHAEIPTYSPQPKLLKTMQEYSDWTDNLGLQDIGSLNEYIVEGRTSELIQISEARHTKFFVETAQKVAEMPEDGRLILLAGPSSSGKTSSAKRLMVQMRVLGLKPFALSLDNYFVDRDDTPLDEDGDFDFESIDAIRVELFNEHLQALMAGKAVNLPRFDFKSGCSVLDDKPTQLKTGEPLIVEGIHALNPALTPTIPACDKLLIYVSALCHVNIDNFSYIRTTNSRLFRRMVRDAKFRGYTASETLARWPKVRMGEEKHIFPFQNNADLFFNSGLTYELPVLKLWAEPRLAAVDSDDPNYGLARSLIDLLTLVLPIDARQVPPTSLLREFIGGSGFEY